MHIIGIGLDLCRVARIDKLYQAYSQKFLEKLLHAEEQLTFNQLAAAQQMNWLAKRFAAKEAAGKALGVGIGRIGLTNIVTYKNANSAQPQLRLAHSDHQHIQWHLSLTDEGDMAAAVALAYTI